MKYQSFFTKVEWEIKQREALGLPKLQFLIRNKRSKYFLRSRKKKSGALK